MSHPELPAEQAYVDHAYECLERMRDQVARAAGAGVGEVAALALEASDRALARTLDRAQGERKDEVMRRRTLACVIAVGAVLALPVALPAASTDVLPEPVSLWAAEGDSRDSADGNHGAAQGRVAYVDGQIGSAFGLDGNSWVRVPSAANLRVSAGNFTVAAWVNLRTLCADTCDQDIVSKMTIATVPNTDGWRLLKQGDGHFWFCFGGSPGGTNGCSGGLSTTVRSRATAVPGRWFHVVGVKSGSTISIFVNGAPNGSTAMRSFKDTNRAPLTIGAYAGVKGRESGQLNGLIDEAQIYNRALSAAQVRELSVGEKLPKKVHFQFQQGGVPKGYKGKVLLDMRTVGKGAFRIVGKTLGLPSGPATGTVVHVADYVDLDDDRLEFRVTDGRYRAGEGPRDPRVVVLILRLVESSNPDCKKGSIFGLQLSDGRGVTTDNVTLVASRFGPKGCLTHTHRWEGTKRVKVLIVAD